MLERIGVGGLDEFCEAKLLGLFAADRQWQRLGNEDAPREDGQVAFFTVGEAFGCADSFVGEEAHVVGNFQLPRKAA